MTPVGLGVSECFRQDERMADWKRVGERVVARRVELGFKNRANFAAALDVSTRLLGDIETGRRGNFDSVTIATLERSLGWVPGSVKLIADGGEPRERAGGPDQATAGSRHLAPRDEIDLIYGSTSMTAREKLERIRMVLELRAQAEADDARNGQETNGTASRA